MGHTPDEEDGKECATEPPNRRQLPSTQSVLKQVLHLNCGPEVSCPFISGSAAPGPSRGDSTSLFAEDSSCLPTQARVKNRTAGSHGAGSHPLKCFFPGRPEGIAGSQGTMELSGRR